MDEKNKLKLSKDYDLNNYNYFNIGQEFFIIDSEYLSDVKTKFYGFSVQMGGIFEQDNMTEEAMSRLDGCGCYVNVDCRDNEQIKIQQDFNGSYGIYLFQNADRFVLSNSFFHLVDYVKYFSALSLNRDYAYHILLAGLASFSYSETSINEIKLLDKDLEILINTKSKNLIFRSIEYGENTIALDSEEGISILDNWYNKWSTLFCKLSKYTDQISINLSGGFDSRVNFAILLSCGLSMNDLNVISYTDNRHTHGEDFLIASQIADNFGFKLNARDKFPKPSESKAIHYSLEDIINIYFYTKMTFHKEMYYRNQKYAKKQFRIVGLGGETLRARWNVTSQKFINNFVAKSSRYSDEIAKEISSSNRKILDSSFYKIGTKHYIDDSEPVKYLSYFYRETWARNHHAKIVEESYFTNEYLLAPLMDPCIRKLNFNSPDCTDGDLLMTLIYTRYCPKLLEFKFEGGRSYNEDTIHFSKEINKRYPYEKKSFPEKDSLFSVITEDVEILDILGRTKNNNLISKKTPNIYLKSVFDSDGLQKLFTTFFDEEIYQYAKMQEKNRDYVPMKECYAIVGLSRVIEDIMFSQKMKHPSVTDSMDRLIFQNLND